MGRQREDWKKEGSSSVGGIQRRARRVGGVSSPRGGMGEWGRVGNVGACRAEWRPGVSLSWKVLCCSSARVLSFYLPSTFPTSPPHTPPHTPQGPVSLRSGKSEGADSQQHHPPPLWWRSPCLFPQALGVPATPPPLPSHPPLPEAFPSRLSCSGPSRPFLSHLRTSW